MVAYVHHESSYSEEAGEVQVTWPNDPLCGRKSCFAELTLLLPVQQLAALERAAARAGLTMGQLFLLIGDYLAGRDIRPPEARSLPNATAQRRKAGFPGDSAARERPG